MATDSAKAEITDEMVEVGVDYCLLSGVEGIALLDVFVLGLFRTMCRRQGIENDQIQLPPVASGNDHDRARPSLGSVFS